MNRMRLLIILLCLGGLVALVVLYRTYWPESIESVSRQWAESTHADASSQSFTHWDEDDPPVIPIECAKCHSTYGFLDFVGEDGTAAGIVENEAMTGTVLYCNVCHNESVHAMTSVTFPSGVTVSDLSSEEVCMECHQGRRATTDVQQAIAGISEDATSDQLSFINVHYAIAAATLMGGEVRGGYQYPDREYVGRFEHADSVEMCADCHDPHSQSIAADECQVCHVEVVNDEDLPGIRTSEPDYDGDGDSEEGIAAEMDALHGMLYAALQDYAAEVVGTPLAYADRFPYFVIDTNEDGEANDDEVNFGNRYNQWTPRLVRAGYNYHFMQQDPGAYVHNARYVLQLLYDSLTDLEEEVDVDVDALIRPTGEEAE